MCRKIGHKSPDCDAMGVLIMYVRVFINLSGDIFMPTCKILLDFHKQSKTNLNTTMKPLRYEDFEVDLNAIIVMERTMPINKSHSHHLIRYLVFTTTFSLALASCRAALRLSTVAL